MNLLNRNIFIERLDDDLLWDIIIIGGGATGLGIAVDAASRGYSTLLVEQSDFAKGTSSRSTKLVHGGVRYLAQGNFKLVYEALHERGLLLKNASHIVKQQSFIVPCYTWIDKWKYLAGLKFYDLLSRKYSFGSSQFLQKEKVLEHLPGIKSDSLNGGVIYFDGQFDDARLAIDLAKTGAEHGAVLVNYCKVVGFEKSNGKLTAVKMIDLESNREYAVRSKSVVNATGVFVDDVLEMDQPGAKPLVRPSQGIHLVVNKSFLKNDHALMIPQTSDGRVLFAVPWHDHLLLGTTDTALESTSTEPMALEQEIRFILDTVKNYFSNPPTACDILSVFAGLRPLAASKNINNTREISRDHKLIVNPSGLVTITGGKWTTYRRMAEHTVDTIIKHGVLPAAACVTEQLRIHGNTDKIRQDHLSVYGSDARLIDDLNSHDPTLSNKICTNFLHTEAEVIWAVRNEMARTVEDVLARRLRILFLDARAAIEAAPRIADIMQKELMKDEAWKQNQLNDFTSLAKQYLIDSYNF
ncbi:MAG: glycerol-3-phosphate dehydrogenase/oxidase [Flavisolibacter sp.]